MMVSHLRGSAGTFLLVVTIFAVSDESTDDGGWITHPGDRLVQPGPCNIAQEDKTLKQDDFLERYAYNQPVVIRGMSDNELFQTLTRRKTLLEGYGHMTVRLSSANSYSYQKQDTTLRHYCNNYLHPQSLNTLGNETFYLFGDNAHEGWEDLLEMYNKPLYTLPGHLPALSFGIAGPGSGVPFHFHGPVFAETIWGRKRWFIYPPDVKPSFHPNHTTLHWLKEGYPKVKDDLNLYECTLAPGEIIYFPDKWWHATLNIDSSVFVSIFLSP
ncbi:jmjC domain-containing protein 8-like isoform X1 [Eriocheir sinensis]|uniref:jmjC domain-containing protein 8-like isoform X1 n=2 Tax=Eriocheir sinensis TaxID=95602 RepID=UPI0021C954DC|nr:jmjC domain-containing protein 8-like isoform X1 [Eriocheir sinensis]